MRIPRILTTPTPQASPRILLLALLPIGDTLFLTPTLRALRARYPTARLVALAHASAAPLLTCVPEVDEVVVLPFRADWAGPARLASTLADLRARRFDVAVNFTTPAYKWISLLCGIPVRTYMKFDTGWWFLPGEHRHWRSTHATKHYYDCARELDLPPWSEVSHVPRIALPPASQAAARAFLRTHAPRSGTRPLVALHPGGAGLGGLKRWPEERFARVAEALRVRWGARIILLGGSEDVPLARRIADRMGAPPVIAAGALPLLGSVALIGACDLFIGNDSSPLHLAAATGTPFVGIYGPTSLGNFRPIPIRPHQGRFALPAWPCFSPRYFVGGGPCLSGPCCEGTCAALETISVAHVVEQANTLLARHFTPAAREALPHEAPPYVSPTPTANLV
ncbi:MAG: glycosyltransferase family 9 protein [Ktedonobacterales bacterium]|nr:glycosyltransferase family 9 protein [Ktedonobacterales bacterium]